METQNVNIKSRSNSKTQTSPNSPDTGLNEKRTSTGLQGCRK